MLNAKVLVLALSCLATARGSRAQCISPECAGFRVATGALGYGSARITNLGTVPNRVMHGLNARLDLRILPLFVRHPPVLTHDALFADFTYGTNTSDTVPSTLPEATIGSQLTFGYELLVGGQVKEVTLLGGLGWHRYRHHIGSTKMTDTFTPLVARLEVGSRRRVVVTAWHAFRPAPMTGARFDLPFTRPFNLTAMYWQADGSAKFFFNYPTTVRPGRARMMMVGLRTVQHR